MERGDPVDPPEVEPAAGIPVVRHGVELVIGDAVPLKESLYLPGSLVEAHQPKVAGQPQEALRIFIDGVEVAVGEAVFFDVFPGGSGVGVPADQACPFGGDPEQAVAVPVKVFHTLVGERFGGGQPFALYAQVLVELVQPLVRTCPKPFLIGVQGIDFHAPQPGQMGCYTGVAEDVQPLVRPCEHAL